MKELAASISLAFLVILSICFIASGNVALGQDEPQGWSVEKWRASETAQKSIVAEQSSFSNYAQQLQSKIDNREFYLSDLLQKTSSDTSTNTGGEAFTSECVIATAAFGSNLTPQVQLLRSFRDDQIKSTAAGTSFMQAFDLVYYSFSPSVAEYERGQAWLQQAVRIAIIPLLSILQLSENGYSLLSGESGALAAGFIASSSIGVIYFSPIAYATLRKKSKLMTTVTLLSLLVAACCVALITIGIFLENAGILMIATATFVLSVLTASATFAAQISRKFVQLSGRNVDKMLKRRIGSARYRAPLILILAIVTSSASISAFGITSVAAQESLSREEIQMQLNRLSEIKRELIDTRLVESIFPTMADSQVLTTRTADFVASYAEGGNEVTEQAFIEGLQYASSNYLRLSSTVYNSAVADRHFTLKETLSNAIEQLSYSTSDVVEYKTCQACDAQRASELYSSSGLTLEISTQNFVTYLQMLQSERRQLENLITEIDNMPDSS